MDATLTKTELTDVKGRTATDFWAVHRTEVASRSRKLSWCVLRSMSIHLFSTEVFVTLFICLLD